MPTRHTRWTCNKCHKSFRDHRAAESCEYDHIIQDAIQGFRDDLPSIFAPDHLASLTPSSDHAGSQP